MFKEKWIFLVLAVGSFFGGFALVYLFANHSPQTEGPVATSVAATPASTAEISSQVQEADTEEMSDEPSSDGELLEDEGTRSSEVPPGPTPDGIRIDGAPLYLRCRSESCANCKDKDCDRLKVLEKRMATRLYVVHNCQAEVGSKGATGLLSLGASIDFKNSEAKFWSGPSSKIPNADAVGKCVRRNLSGIPLHGIEHKFDEYRLFFTVEFFDPQERAKEVARKRKSGRPSKVIKDRVNLREKPVDGMVLGRINKDAPVHLLKKNEKGDWCQILTVKNKEGWIICDALDKP